MKRKAYLLIIALLSVASSGALLAQHQHEQEAKSGHSHAKAEIHGGEVTMTKAHHFEVVWMPDHVMVYLYDANQKPLAAKGESEAAFTSKYKMMSMMHQESGKHEQHH